MTTPNRFPPAPVGAPAIPAQPQPQPAWGGMPPAAQPLGGPPARFTFDGGAGTYLGTGMLAVLITVCTLGICYPFALVLRERWRAKHSYIDGRQLEFTGSAVGLFGLWIKWFLLCIVTVGIYSFWVGPRIAGWRWVNTSFAH